jgi:hypothetical protein
MVLDDAFVAASDENEMLDSGLAGLVHDVLDQRPVDHRQHFLGHGLGRGQEPGAKPSYRKHRFADWFHAMSCGKGGNGGFAGQTWASKLLSKLVVKGQIRRN